MFFNQLTKKQQNMYLKSVVLDNKYDDISVEEMNCEAVDNLANNERYYLSFTIYDNDTNELVPLTGQEIFDFMPDRDHLRFMIKYKGVEYLSALKSYVKNNDEKKEYSQELIADCDKYFQKVLCKDRKVKILDHFLDDVPQTNEGNRQEESMQR